MKHLIVFITLVAVVAGTGVSVRAVEVDTATPRPTVRQEKKEARPNLEKAIQAKRAAAQRRSEKLEAHCEKIATTMGTLMTRVDSRIQKQKGEGKDTARAEAALTEARTNLSSATALCAQAVEKFDSVPQDQWSEQHASIKEARSLAKQAQEMFVKARKAIAQAIESLVSNARATR